jgi:hypothetical protein
MSVFNMSAEEKQKILEKHKKAMKAVDDKKTENKEGLKSPKKENKKSS